MILISISLGMSIFVVCVCVCYAFCGRQHYSHALEPDEITFREKIEGRKGSAAELTRLDTAGQSSTIDFFDHEEKHVEFDPSQLEQLKLLGNIGNAANSPANEEDDTEAELEAALADPPSQNVALHSSPNANSSKDDGQDSAKSVHSVNSSVSDGVVVNISPKLQQKSS